MKIAIIGRLPSAASAPFDDPSWRIWGIGPGSRPHLRRADALFELHEWQPEQSWFDPPAYPAFVRGFDGPVFMLRAVEDVPNAVTYPREDVLGYFGRGSRWFLSSSAAWAVALAVMSGAAEVGLWGIDMAETDPEYGRQRWGVLHFLAAAIDRGVKVTVPPDSSLAWPASLYGYDDFVEVL